MTLTTTTVTGNCLVTGDRTLAKGVAMATNVTGTPIQIKFGMRGNTEFTTDPETADSGNIILYQPSGPTSGRKCVAISPGIGILRSGTYLATEPTTPAASISTTCKQSE